MLQQFVEFGAGQRVADIGLRLSAAGVPTLAVLTGGFAAAELSEAGAAGVAESIAELREDRGRLLAVAR